ncbi:MAG TPA: TetR/AcrR family transcriptional regulator [Actinomycetes bacterium]|nr:TetR/AcrR family transcriptional regulator [Actinomycetes bacterium]
MTVSETGVRDRVLEAGVQLFAAQGYDATSVAQIVAMAGVAKGGFYHHFTSKEQLLYAVYGDLIERQLLGMDRILAAGRGPAETLRALILDLVETTAERAPQALVFMRERHRLGDERTEQFRVARRRYHDAVVRLVHDAQADGRFSAVASPETVTLTIFGVINELPVWYRPRGRKQPRQLGSEIADFVLAALERTS